MPLAAEQSILPLPMTAFEALMMSDDRPNYPICFFVQCHLRGTINRTAFEDALDESLNRNPLMCSIVQERWTGRRWIWAPEKRPRIDWNDIDVPITPTDPLIDLRHEVGTRIWIRESTDKAEPTAIVTYQIHHACCDGIGFSQFIADLAIQYAALTTQHDSPPTLPPINLELLRTRDDQSIRKITVPSTAKEATALDAIKQTIVDLREAPVPLQKPPSRPKPSKTTFPDIHFHTFDRATTRRIREVARANNATLNDVLMCDVMLAVNQWNIANEGPQDGRIRILMTNSLRTGIDEELPAANVVGFNLITRELDKFSTRGELLSSLASQTKTILWNQQGWVSIKALQALKRFGLLWTTRALLGNTSFSTVIMSHLGNLLNKIATRLERIDGELVIGDLVMTQLLCVPPVREGTYVAFSSYLQSGKLTANIRCDPMHFGPDNAEEILGLFVKQLEITAHSDVPQPTLPPRPTTSKTPVENSRDISASGSL